jgi:hypothetical protein
MKTFGIIVTYLGVTLLGLATIFSAKLAWVFISAPAGIWTNPPWENWVPYQYVILAFVASIPGTLFAFLGMFIARTRYISIIVLVIGIFYAIPSLTVIFYPIIKGGMGQFDSFMDFIIALIWLLPGIACIVGGFIMRNPETN